mmetsp:Transcript_8354/g.12595  ORF Transcript_8354/g.12595 Transcript_8354/m.12595 type:complete len:133 (+) Transcript_8354:421-819(+)
MKARVWKRSTLVGVLGVRLHHAAEEQKSEVPGSSGILWLKINKAIFIFNISTLSSSDYMSFSFVYHVDCIILSLVSSAKCVCFSKHGSKIIYDRELRHSRTHGSQLPTISYHSDGFSITSDIRCMVATHIIT